MRRTAGGGGGGLTPHFSAYGALALCRGEHLEAGQHSAAGLQTVPETPFLGALVHSPVTLETQGRLCGVGAASRVPAMALDKI